MVAREQAGAGSSPDPSKSQWLQAHQTAAERSSKDWQLNSRVLNKQQVPGPQL